MRMEGLNSNERMAVAAVRLLGTWNVKSRKRVCEDSPDTAGGLGRQNKVARTELETEQALVPVGPSCPPREEEIPVLRPYPFFFYRDFSFESDPDPLIPLTSPGRVPNFPAKIHSILSRSDLSDIIAWMPHGRSWRVLKPREFEVKVIPAYFEHSKFSSFIRQANGWGFRRITQGQDRNSYYHELFLRGLPHLCKKMKRPRVAEKKTADPEHEPNFYKISEMFPVPDKAADDSVLLQCTLQGGPKARMPIWSGPLPVGALNGNKLQKTAERPAPTVMTKLTPKDELSLNAFQQSVAASEQQLRGLPIMTNPTNPTPCVAMPLLSAAAPVNIMSPSVRDTQNKLSTLAAANRLAIMSHPNVSGAFNRSTAASPFAAGFAAAAALGQQQYQSLLSTLAVEGKQPRRSNTFAQSHFTQNH